jgi:hypothetical protein
MPKMRDLILNSSASKIEFIFMHFKLFKFNELQLLKQIAGYAIKINAT